METRKQMLQSTYRRHKFEVDSKEILNRLEEKEKSLQDSKDPNQLIFEIETLKDKVSFFYEMSRFWVRSGRLWDWFSVEVSRIGYRIFPVKACQVKSVSGLVLTESGSGRVWDFLNENWVRLTSELARADWTVFNRVRSSGIRDWKVFT